MNSPLGNLVDVPSGARSLASRVREAVDQLVLRETLLVDAPVETPGEVLVVHEHRRVAVIDGDVFGDGSAWVTETIASAVRGDNAMIVVGAMPESIQSLLTKGVYDVVDAGAPIARLALSIRNALEMLELKERAENRARWLRRYRYEAGTLIDTARALTQERDTTKLLEMILEKCRFIAGADAGSIYVVEGSDPDFEKRALRFKLSQNESVSFPTGEFVMPISRRSIAGSVAIARKVTSLDDVYALPKDTPFSFDRSFDERVGYRTKSVLTVPLVSAEDEVIGVVQLINKKRDPRSRLRAPEDADREVVPFDDRSIELVTSLAGQAGIALENAMLYEEIRKILEGFVRASVQAIEQRDPTTSGHSLRVSVLSIRLAEAVNRTEGGAYGPINFTKQDLREIEYASLLHDFGKIGVREQVLVKAKKLYDSQLHLLRARFDFLTKSFEAEYASKRADLFARNGPSLDLQELEVDYQRRVGEIEGFWSLISQANEPTVLPQSASERLEQLEKLTYLDPRGVKQPWVRPDEMVCLRIRRGSLTSEEFDEIRSHVTHTFEFLSRIPWGKTFTHVPMIAGSHHERLNGKGYPRGLSGEAIPHGARIMAIADIFDALTASDRPYKKAVPMEKALDILEMEVKDGGIDPDLMKIFVGAGVYRAIEEKHSY